MELEDMELEAMELEAMELESMELEAIELKPWCWKTWSWSHGVGALVQLFLIRSPSAGDVVTLWPTNGQGRLGWSATWQPAGLLLVCCCWSAAAGLVPVLELVAKGPREVQRTSQAIKLP